MTRATRPHMEEIHDSALSFKTAIVASYAFLALGRGTLSTSGWFSECSLFCSVGSGRLAILMLQLAQSHQIP